MVTRGSARGGGSRLRLAAAVALVVTAGCSPVIHDATRPASGALAPPGPDHATLVVTQSNVRFRLVNILDGQGVLVGQLTERSHVAIPIAPGPFRVYALAERHASTGDRIEGTVAAGKTYIGHIGWRWPGINFIAVTPRTDMSPEERAQLLHNPRLELDPSETAKANAQLGDTAPLLRTIDTWVEGLTADERDARTIVPSDGR